MWAKQRRPGFTIVELLIVIVVIAILASISVAAYSGIQARGRDSQRRQDVKTIVKALEMYYVDNGRYPSGLCDSDCAVNGGWSTTNDASWANLANELVPKYISSLPVDPNPSMGLNPTGGGSTRFGYGYFATRSNSNYCGSSNNQAYILVYTLESGSQENTLNGACNDNPVGPYVGKSNYRVAIGGS